MSPCLQSYTISKQFIPSEREAWACRLLLQGGYNAKCDIGGERDIPMLLLLVNFLFVTL